jgi:mannose-6-phosphate isomerase
LTRRSSERSIGRISVYLDISRSCGREARTSEQESIIAVEHAGVRLLPKPWGSLDLRPWTARCPDGVAIGEIWFQRTITPASDPALLLKLLFANESLSIQVHPDDAFARSIGLPHGKTEAWYILSATPDAKVAVGLKQQVTTQQLRASIEDGSIADLVLWRQVAAGDVVLIPAGTIHAIGPGLVIAEIQQRSDTTFRLFDYGRHRELHVDNAVAVARGGPPDAQTAPRRLTDARTLLITCPYFVLERIDLPPQSVWELDAPSETWLLVIDGHARLGPTDLYAGDALFMDADRAILGAGPDGLSGLVAYPATQSRQNLLRELAGHTAGPAVHSREAQA